LLLVVVKQIYSIKTNASTLHPFLIYLLTDL